MSEARLWNAYRAAWERFEAAPSLRNEAAVVATFAEWAHAFVPDHAADVITLLHSHIATRLPSDRGAA